MVIEDFRIIPSYCFASVGIYYAGPIYIKQEIYSSSNREMYKFWLALITCCTSRAIYLNITSSCNGLSCIKVLGRFSGRYV